MAGRVTEPTTWDGRFEIALGDYIERFLAANPPPDGSEIADDARTWSRNLLDHGHARLDERRVRVVALVTGEDR
jgi:hypothetical protein